MEAVDEPPGDLGGKRFEPRTRKQVEDGGNDGPAFGLRGKRFGHVMFAWAFARLDDAERDRIAKGPLKIGTGGDGGIKRFKISKAVDAAGIILGHGLSPG